MKRFLISIAQFLYRHRLLPAPPLAQQMCADKEFVRRVEQGERDIEEGRCSYITLAELARCVEIHGLVQSGKEGDELMGEASELVGSPSAVPPPTATAALEKVTVLTELQSVLDKLDRAIQVKDRDLLAEQGKEGENALKLSRLKGAEVMVRQARALLADYGTGLAEATGDDVEDEDEYAWVLPGVRVVNNDDDVYVIESVDRDAEEVVLHVEGHDKFKATYNLDDFLGEFEEAEEPNQ